MNELRIGVSGWKYPSWRGNFYPIGLPIRQELAYLSTQINSAELNGSFYSLQKPARFRTWHDQTPTNFRFAVKGGRYITHLKKLVGIDIGLANFFASGVLALSAKLGPILWQLPPSMRYQPDRLEAFLRLLPRTTEQAAELAAACNRQLVRDPLLHAPISAPIRHAIEVRHDSFICDEFRAQLAAHRIALVVADTAGKWPMVEWFTTDFRYARLHGHTRLYGGEYGRAGLVPWADRITEWQRMAEPNGLDIYVYFDNDADGYAPFDAIELSRQLADRKLIDVRGPRTLADGRA